MTFIPAKPTAALVFDEPTEYIDRTLATASWWDKYEIQPGTYPFEWATLGHKPWNPNPEAHTQGFIANVGPYYGLVRVQARLVEEYRVARLFGEARGEQRAVDGKVVTITRDVYAYQLPGCPKGERGRTLETFLGGYVVDLRPEHERCEEFAEAGSCIHSDHMQAAGL